MNVLQVTGRVDEDTACYSVCEKSVLISGVCVTRWPFPGEAEARDEPSERGLHQCQHYSKNSTLENVADVWRWAKGNKQKF